MKPIEPEAVHAWVRSITTTNPFTHNRVTQAEDLPADVPAVHDREFRTITRRIQEVRATGQAAGILLTGAAGVGKSHLLARLFQWAHHEGAATVVYLHNVLASPERIPRYLLRALVSTMAGNHRHAYPESLLYQVINRAIQAELAGSGLPSPKKRLSALIALGRQLDPMAEVFSAVVSFLDNVMKGSEGDEKAIERATSAVEWLSGGLIQNKRASELNVPEGKDEEGSALLDDEAVRRVLGVLAGLSARGGRPFVLCIDQVDNLPPESVSAMAAFLHASLDNCRSLVVVTSGVRESMMKFKADGVIPDAAWDRLAQQRVDLMKVSPDEARQMVRTRVERFNQAFRDEEDLAALFEQEPLLPLSSNWLRERFQRAPEFRARDVLGAARESWEWEQELIRVAGGESWLDTIRHGEREEDNAVPEPIADKAAAIDAYVLKKVQQAKTERLLKPESLPSDADNLATLCFDLLLRCVGREEYSLVSARRVPLKPTPAFLLEATERTPSGEVVTNGVAFCSSESANAATWCLKRILGTETPPNHLLLVTDDERSPLQLGKKGAELYGELQKNQRFHHLRMAFDDYALLDALHSVLGSAFVGDLELDQMGVLSADDCAQSMHRQKLFLQQPLLAELLTEAEPPPKSKMVDPAREAKIRERIEHELRWRLGLTAREMTQIIIEREKLSTAKAQGLFEMVKLVAQKIHADGTIFAVAEDDDLYLQLRKVGPA
jgi:hypothetical protein